MEWNFPTGNKTVTFETPRSQTKLIILLPNVLAGKYTYAEKVDLSTELTTST
jgi:hypothetical protein